MPYTKTIASIELAKELEPTAQEMFEKLGYDKIVEDEQFIYYKHKLNKTNLMIIIDILWKEYACVENKVSRQITLEEHQAIHQKIKELGWIK